MKTIDSHHHFWKYDPVEYSWIDDPMEKIRRDFLPEDLAMVIKDAGVDGVISVQARQSLEETKWLLDLSRQNSFIKGVVGWVPLTSPKLETILSGLTHDHELKSVRHVIQGESDDNFILRDDFNRGVGLLEKVNLAYDILILEKHLPQTIEFVDMHPAQVFILDHIAKPKIGKNILSPWRENMIELARRQNVYCKISGMVTEADYLGWTEEQLQPYFDTVIEAFGPDRLMFGSDWPVCTVACEYRRWIEITRKNISRLSASEQERILSGTAIEAYKLDNRHIESKSVFKPTN
ncbi:MAG TPA: amidohydrolase [Lentisphaeria bacterium]|nr:MAG: amidohydrolase [Lentisphaerae bacterium GWF2_50_93]HCE43235.1 amidohydrolase [Lentisphaeria bacterium]